MNFQHRKFILVRHVKKVKMYFGPAVKVVKKFKSWMDPSGLLQRKLSISKIESYHTGDRIFKRLSKMKTLAESFYFVKYGSSNIMSIIPSNNLFCVMSFQIYFFKQSAILAFFILFWF